MRRQHEVQLLDWIHQVGNTTTANYVRRLAPYSIPVCDPDCTELHLKEASLARSCCCSTDIELPPWVKRGFPYPTVPMQRNRVLRP
jgi:hypothetical protein